MLAPTINRALELVLPWLGPFVSNTLATRDRARRQLGVDYCGRAATSLQIHSHERSNLFAGLLKYTQLQRIVKGIAGRSMFWCRPFLALDNNKDSLKSLEMRGFLAGLLDLEDEVVASIQVFPVYMQHLYRCDFLTHLELQMPPPCNMWNGRLLQRMFSRLEHLAIRGNDWILPDENYLEFSHSFARASRHFGNLLQLSLSWDMPNVDDFPPKKPSSPLSALLPFGGSASLALEGFVHSELMLESLVADTICAWKKCKWSWRTFETVREPQSSVLPKLKV